MPRRPPRRLLATRRLVALRLCLLRLLPGLVREVGILDGVDRLVREVGGVVLDLFGGLLGVLGPGAHLLGGPLRVLLDLGGMVTDSLRLFVVDDR